MSKMDEKVMKAGPVIKGPGFVFETYLYDEKFIVSAAGAFTADEILRMADYLKNWVERNS
jgi:hypothetical protein